MGAPPLTSFSVSVQFLVPSYSSAHQGLVCWRNCWGASVLWAAWTCQTMVRRGRNPILGAGLEPCRYLQFLPTILSGFDADLLTLVPALGRNKALKHLWLGKNFSVKAR